MVRQPKVLLMIIHSLLWLCSNISQRLFVCCIFVLRSSDIWWLHCTAVVPRPKCWSFSFQPKVLKSCLKPELLGKCAKGMGWWRGGEGEGSWVFRTGFCNQLLRALLFHNRSWCECSSYCSSTEVQLVILGSLKLLRESAIMIFLAQPTVSTQI